MRSLRRRARLLPPTPRDQKVGYRAFELTGYKNQQAIPSRR
jgi:hypothetical protein